MEQVGFEPTISAHQQLSLGCSHISKRAAAAAAAAAMEKELTVQIRSGPFIPNKFFYAPLHFCKHF
jgi:hypothetical protein